MAATEAEADELLTRLLSRFPGRGNRVEESGFHTSDGPRAGAVGTTGSTVHLVITPDEDDGEPLARDVFDTAGAATRRARELRSAGESVVIAEMTMGALPEQRRRGG
ncbi:hypothetical protein [Janibacter corallicola]|uniref:hypothetical protein n=1 Tax=Janibacter corallicola TaxID=415212 RepID=UPI0012ED058F|nr:hypothetical protein [Janibacter corallicola]